MDGSVVFGWRCHVVVSFVPVFPMGPHTFTKKEEQEEQEEERYSTQSTNAHWGHFGNS